jgi:hypothetical protein
VEIAVVGASATLAALATSALAGGTLQAGLTAAIAMAGAAAAYLLLPRYPVAAVGLVFGLAAFSRVLIDLPVGTMRLEQPAIVALLAGLIWYRRSLDLPSLRPFLPLIAAAGVYLLAMTLSSVLVAEDALASLRLVLWTALSMCLGLAAALLVYRSVPAVLPALTAPVAVVAIIGIAGGVGFFLTGPGFPLVSGITVPKVHALVYEPNLYASLIAAVIPLAAELYRARARLLFGAGLALLLLALGLGVTRAAYVGLGVGLLVWFALQLVHDRRSAGLRAAALVIVFAGAAGMVLPAILLDRPPSSGPPPADPSEPSGPVLPEPDPNQDFETLDYRLRQVDTALRDLPESPLIGMGAFSYGQRHISPEGRPASIGVWPIVVLYDSGLVGLIALSSFFAVLAGRLLRAARRAAQPGVAIAFLASMSVLLVAYLATSALHFAVTWVILGCAVAATLGDEPAGDARSIAGGPR